MTFDEKDVRWKKRFENYKKAVSQLKEFMEKESLNKFEVQGLIQCFEYTFEFAWKTMKDYLEAEGFEVKSPRQTLMTAFQTGLITEGHIWIDALQKRNLMAHTYDESKVIEAEKLIKDQYYAEIVALADDLEAKG